MTLAVGSLACYRPASPPPTSSSRQAGITHRIRMLDQDGQLLSTLRLARRSATLSDDRGIRLGRAKSVTDRVIVTDRSAQTVLVFRPDQTDVAPDRSTRSLWIEDGAGLPLGWLEFTSDGRVVLFEPDGQTLATVMQHPEAQSDVGAEMRWEGASEPSYRVTQTGRHIQTVTRLPQETSLTWGGMALDAWIVAAFYLPAPPDLPDMAGELFGLGIFLAIHQCRREGGCFPD